MKILPDTHLLLWAANGNRPLSALATAILEDPENVLYFSAASIWEICIKKALQRTGFSVDPPDFHDKLLENGYVELPITSAQAFRVITLPPIHKDPFDRILVAQAADENCLLLTADPIIARYPGPIRLV